MGLATDATPDIIRRQRRNALRFAISLSGQGPVQLEQTPFSGASVNFVRNFTFVRSIRALMAFPRFLASCLFVPDAVDEGPLKM